MLTSVWSLSGKRQLSGVEAQVSQRYIIFPQREGIATPGIYRYLNHTLFIA
ncbi:hypothetical protein HMPREF3220_01682 [Citrobacter koseri]|nr:hypothetical protein HMPREF3220_01682 [Citrobacter koseri]KXA06594.1 hypothetical protein HMPREF3207_00142 [Citrobacter koseri]